MDASQRFPWPFSALIGILFAEAVLVAASAVLLGASGSGWPLIATVALLAIGVGMLGFGLIRRWRRIRGGIITWQIMQVAVSIAAFQGLLGPWWIGWLLLVPAVVAIWLTVSRPVTSVLAPNEEHRP